MKKWFSSLGVWQIFGALLLVIALMSVSISIVHRNSISDIYETLSDHHAQSVKSMILTYDDRFREIQNLIFTIQSLPYDNLLDKDGNIDMTRVYALQGQMVSLLTTHEVVEEVIVFYNGVPFVITSEGTSTLDYLFDTKYKNPTKDAQFWKRYLSSKHDFEVFPAENYTVLSGATPEYRKKKLMVMASGNRMAISNKNILVLMDVDAFLQQVNRAGLLPGASLIILDQNQRFLMGTESNLNLAEVLNEAFSHSQEEVSLTREDYEYQIFKSDFSNLIYISRVPYQFQNLSSVTKANRAIILWSIFGAVLLSVLLSIYLYRPIQHILRLLGGGTIRGNDFRKIEAGISKLQRENDEYRQQLQAAENELRRGMFLRLLEQMPLAEERERELDKYRIDLLRGRYFVMAAFRLERKDAAEEPLPPEALVEKLQKGLQGAGLNASVFHERGYRYLALIERSESGDRKKLLRLLRDAVRDMETGDLQTWRIRGCLSRLYQSDPVHLRDAYEDVQFGLMHVPTDEKEPVADAEEWENHAGLHVSFEQMEKLSNCLLGGKADEAQAIIRKTFQSLEENRSGRYAADLVAKTMFYRMVKLANEAGVEKDAIRKLERDFHRAAEETFSVRQMEQLLLDAASAIAACGRKEQAGKLNPAFIRQYIELHYMENLYLDHMAEIFDTTPKYFSNYFKKAFGINFVEYLNRVRLAHARELLRNTNLPVAEIGEKTGYLNPSTFTSTFKKYCGISPSDYRTRCLNGDEEPSPANSAPSRAKPSLTVISNHHVPKTKVRHK